MPKVTALATPLDSRVAEALDSIGVPSTKVINETANWLLEFSAMRMSQKFATKPDDCTMADWLNAISADHRSVLEGLAIVNGDRIAEVMNRTVLHILAEHYLDGRWLYYAQEAGVDTFRSYAYWLFRKSDDPPSRSTATRWVNVILLAEKLYLRVGQRRPILELVGIDRKSLPAATATAAIQQKVVRWGRFAHNALSALSILEEDPQISYHELDRDKHRHKYDAAQRFRHMFSLEQEGEQIRELDKAAAGAAQKAIEPFTIPTEVAATLTPRQKAELTRLDWVRLPGDYKPDQKEVRFKIELWPECPKCKPSDSISDDLIEDNVLLPMPDGNFVCPVCLNIYSPHDVTTWRSYRFIQWDTGTTFTSWCPADDTIKISNWKSEQVEVGGIHATILTSWLNDDLSSVIAKIMDEDGSTEPPVDYDMAAQEPEFPKPTYEFPSYCPECDTKLLSSPSDRSILCISCAALIKGKEMTNG